MFTNQVIGTQNRDNGSYIYPWDGYLTEINFIDGQALTASDFGEYDAITGVWKAKKYSGTYGTNGFYLNFSDNTSATTLGYDYSGNGNNWTANNISLTSGVTYDSMTDVPTPYADGGNGRGNYCVLNLLEKATNNYTFSDGNLAVSGSGAGSFGAGSTIAVNSGKWYWEQTITAKAATDSANSGIRDISGNSLTAGAFSGGVAGSYIYRSDAVKRNNATSTAYGATFTTNDVIGVALDLDSGTITFYKNGTSQGTAYSGLSGTFEPVGSGDQSSGTTSYAFNFGQRPFAYTPPTGFKALNTFNLPEPDIVDGGEYFNAVTYTGTGASQSITVDFQPDFVWVKKRSGAANHFLADSVRGATKALLSDSTHAEYTDAQYLTSFNSNGFSIGTDTGYNASGSTYVSWNWKAGGTAVSNTDGSITSSVSANTTSGFSVVTYTGNGNASETVGHGLGVTPKMVIVKKRSTTSGWYVAHYALDNSYNYAYHMFLNTTAAKSGSNDPYFLGSGNTSSVINVLNYSGSNGGNESGTTYVAYCFSEVAGFSKFGSYTGNGSADGPFVFTNFLPRYVLIKQSDAVRGWEIHDTARSTYNANQAILEAQSSGAESVNSAWAIDVTSNGFKIRTSDSSHNVSGGTYIFAAFAENPFKNSLAR
jgi:hypothetical protein